MKKYVWYVSYGSNLQRERFMYYIQGGTPKGSSRAEVGCTDKTPPQEDQPIFLHYSLYFSKKSSKWHGSVAFLRTEQDEDSETLGRAYLVTEEQFQEIVKQENGNIIDPINLDEIIETGSGCISTAYFYNFIIYLGKINGIDAFTFTSKGSSNANNFVGPSKEYFDTIVSGIVETYGYSKVEAAEYLRKAIKRSHDHLLKIDNIITNYVNNLVEQNFSGYEISSKKIKEEISLKYGVNPSSIIPSDYCYNRVNNGIDHKKKPTLFKYIKPGKYSCLGNNYSYNGVVYHKPQKSKWGVCEDGIRKKD